MCVETFLLLGLHCLTLKCGIYQEGRLKPCVKWTIMQDLRPLVFQSLCPWFSVGLQNLYNILCCSLFEYHLICKPFLITAYQIICVKVFNNKIVFKSLKQMDQFWFCGPNRPNNQWWHLGCYSTKVVTCLSLIIIHGGWTTKKIETWCALPSS